MNISITVDSKVNYNSDIYESFDLMYLKVHKKMSVLSFVQILRGYFLLLMVGFVFMKVSSPCVLNGIRMSI